MKDSNSMWKDISGGKGMNREQRVLEELKKIMHQFTMENYGVPLNIPVRWDGRLKVTWGLFSVKRLKDSGYYKGKFRRRGEFLPETMRISLNRSLLTAKNKDVVVSIAKHEALHFALCVKGKPFLDGEPYFENELRKHGLVSTSVHRNDLKVKQRMYVWICTECREIVIQGGKTRKDYSKGYQSMCCEAEIQDMGWQKISETQTKIL